MREAETTRESLFALKVNQRIGGDYISPESEGRRASSSTQPSVSLCLEKLAEPQRVALEMEYFEGRSQAEIAKVLNQPLGTIKGRIRSGIMNLRKCLS